MADQLHVDAELVQDVLEEDHLAADAVEQGGDAVVGGHIDLVRHGGEVVATRGHVVHIGDDRLATLPEMLQRSTELVDVSHDGGRVFRLEEDILDIGILCRGIDGADGIPDADRGGLGALQGSHGGHGQFLGGLLGEGDLTHVDLQDRVLGDGRGAAAGGSHRTDETEEEEETDDTQDKEAADDGQNHFYKILHVTACDITDGKFNKIGKIS